MWGEEGLVVIVRRSIEYLTAMINGPARLKVMADRPTHTCIPGNRRLSVPADKTGSRAPSYTPHRGPTYVRTSAMQQHAACTRRGVEWRGVAWRYRGMRGGSRLCMLAASVATRRTFPALRWRRYDPHVPPPRNTCARTPSLRLSPSFVVHHPRVDSRFFSFRFILLFCCVDKCREKTE